MAIVWDGECKEAFGKLKGIYISIPILAYANFLKLLEYILMHTAWDWEQSCTKIWMGLIMLYWYFYGNNFVVYMDTNPLTYTLTSAKLDATGHLWVASLANYNFALNY